MDVMSLLFVFIGALILGCNIAVLGINVKIYSEMTKTHVFVKKDGRGI